MKRRRGRPAATVASIALGIVSLADLAYGLYQTIFAIAGKIQTGD